MSAISIGAVKFEIPDWLDARNDDGILVAYPPETDYANLRISVSTIATEDGKPSLALPRESSAALRRRSRDTLMKNMAEFGIAILKLPVMVLPPAQLLSGTSASVRIPPWCRVLSILPNATQL
jgi:hypothetical protein